MSDEATTLVETIEFRAVAPKPKLQGLDEALTKLRALETTIKSVKAQLADLSTNTSFKLSPAQFAAQAKTKGPQGVAAMARLLGFPDIKDVQAYARQLQAEQLKAIEKLKSQLESAATSPKRGSTRAQDALKRQIQTLENQSFFTSAEASTLKNPTQAGRFFEQYSKAALKNKAGAEKALAAILSGAAPSGGGAAAGVAGAKLVVPVDRIEAVLGPGKVKLTIPAENAEGTAITAGAAGTPAAKGKTPRKEPLSTVGGAPAMERITEYADNEDAKIIQQRFITGIDQQVDVYLKGLNEEFKRVTVNSPAKKRLAELRSQMAGIQNEIREFGASGNTRKDPRAAAAFFKKQASQAAALIPNPQEQAELDALGLSNWKGRTEALAATLSGRAKSASAYADWREKLEKDIQARRDQQRDRQNRQRMNQFSASGQRAQKQRDAARQRLEDFQRKQDQEAQYARGTRTAGIQAIMDFRKQGGEIVSNTTTMGGERRIVLQREEGGNRHTLSVNLGAQGSTASMQVKKLNEGGDRLDKAVAGLSLRNMTANLLKVTEWAAAVTVLYKTFELAEYSLHRLEETGLQMAHLSIVFRGVGGSVQDLTQDMIRLASAQGQETEETMKSAIEWSRLGGDRKTINQEVEVSAKAANIAEMSMGETTKQLMSLMHIYHLEAGDLNNTLGMLVNTSLKYNVTLEEMFTGLDRSAAAARVAGIGLAELQAMIGVVVGATGQTGSMTGNSLKYIFQEISKPGVQRQLRGFGIESLDNNLQMKPTGEILGELSSKWAGLGPRSQQQLSTLLGGRFNAARVPVVLEEYPKILKLALDAQLNLNKAQEANAKILDTLHAQLAGLRAEWDRIVMSSGTLGPLTTLAQTFKNVLKLAGTPGSASASAPAVGSLSDAQVQRLSNIYTDGGKFPYGADYGRQVTAELGRREVERYKKGGHGLAYGLGAEFFGSRIAPLDFFNAWQDYVPGAAGQSGYDARTAALQQSMSVNDLRRREFGLGISQLKNGSMNQETANIMAEVMQGMNGQKSATSFLTAFQGGDQAGAMKILSSMQEQAGSDLLKNKGEAAAAAANRVQQLQQSSDAITKQIAEADKLGKAHSDLDQDLQNNDDALQKAKQDANDLGQAYQDLASDIDEVREAQSRYGGVMQSQQGLMQNVEQFFKGVTASNPIEEQAQSVASLQAQLSELSSAQKNFSAAHAGSVRPEDVGLNEWFSQQILDVQAKLNAANGPAARSMALARTQYGFGTQRAQSQFEGAAYGIDQTARLLNQRAEVLREIDDLEGKQNRTTEEYGRLAQDVVLAQQNSLALRERAAQVERDILQLSIDQNKEFVRQFFGDGPAEMLRKLGAFRMAFNPDGTKRPMSQGQFFSMGPEMRRDFGMLNPDYNPDMIFLKNERTRMSGAIQQIFGDLGAGFDKSLMGLTDKFGKSLGGLPNMNFPLEALDNAKASMDNLANAAGRAADNLNRLASIQPGTSAAASTQDSTPTPHVPQSGGSGGARGYSGFIRKGEVIGFQSDRKKPGYGNPIYAQNDQ